MLIWRMLLLTNYGIILTIWHYKHICHFQWCRISHFPTDRNRNDVFRYLVKVCVISNLVTGVNRDSETWTVLKVWMLLITVFEYCIIYTNISFAPLPCTLCLGYRIDLAYTLCSEHLGTSSWSLGTFLWRNWLWLIFCSQCKIIMTAMTMID